MPFTKRSEQRISNTVQQWERYPKDRADSNVAPTTSVGLTQVVIAAADIEHNSFGNANYASGSALTATLTENASKQFSVYNPGLKVWDGATLWIAHCRLPQSGKNQWYIVNAWSATRIRCTAPAGGLGAGSSAVCTGVTALDGHYSPTTATVFSWTTNVDVQGSQKLLAELVWTGTVSRWEIYSADCT